ncbi:MAG: hypothetical protein SFW35_10910 [Chitinophagales bacterium]|nr:hypothetical protein [Chitinophagales bacterium]
MNLPFNNRTYFKTLNMQLSPMKLKFTRADLLKKLYDETGVTENQAINDAFALNYNLREEYHTFEDVKAALDAVRYLPSQVCIKAILDYSSSTQLEATV